MAKVLYFYKLIKTRFLQKKQKIKNYKFIEYVNFKLSWSIFKLLN